jgi:hypothetical protein
MFEEELNSLLKKKWSEDELQMINKLLENLTYYKRIIPRSLKNDIAVALQMCNNLKIELETFREKCTCINKEEYLSTHPEHLESSIKQFEISVEELEYSIEKLESNVNKTDDENENAVEDKNTI